MSANTGRHDLGNVSRETPYGTVEVNWKTSDSATLLLDISIPSGSEATLILPESVSGYTLNGVVAAGNTTRLAAGAYFVSCSM
ncbi:MAG: hypothetical protein LBC19_12290 [Tannerella sp.]|nr:hypothetical protein [Tannerella sp.]